MKKILLLLSGFIFFACSNVEVPLPEHPRPDFQRSEFINLNGYWNFTFDESLSNGPISSFDKKILVPFPWGSELSEVKDEGDVAYYGRTVKVPSSWKGKRVFVVVGASDWETTAWLDGQELGSHQGGYTPFEFEITDLVKSSEQSLVLKVDDTYSDSHLYGKQGYGNARGIWQTVYLEARGENYIKSIHFSPDIDNSQVAVDVVFDSAVPAGASFSLAFKNGDNKNVEVELEEGSLKTGLVVPVENQHLWNLDDPYLYEVSASLLKDGKTTDKVDSYFGQRKISAMQVPGQDFKYVALNNSPVYLQLCLDQSYHPQGFYTFPSDEFMKNEILLSKKLGLNGNRIHIKVEVPRKLYWADKLGLLIMADVPNFWGEPVPEAREDWERTMRAQVERDFNHPSIFAWVDFNETWGLFSTADGVRSYRPETQEWVRSMYHLTKSLDPTRLVEDNSVCNHDHVETDINSWHAYNTNYEWESVVANFDDKTYPGTAYNYINGNVAGDEPMINSECGNVWGYEGSAGDCDFTWDYHEMMNAFHRHIKQGGWLYTEHHDVINEWNGYVKFDRSEKIDGLDSFVPGMTIADFHSPYYIVPEGHFFMEVKAGSEVHIPLYSSFVTDKNPGAMTLEVSYAGFDGVAGGVELGQEYFEIPFEPFKLKKVAELVQTAPLYNDLVTVRLVLKDSAGKVLSRNFCLVKVTGAEEGSYCKDGSRVSFSPASFTASQWSIKQAQVYDGLKVNGFGNGYYEYEVTLPEGAKNAKLVFEASAKQLFGKDVEDGTVVSGEFMLGEGTLDPCKIANAYAMTDTNLKPSAIDVQVNGKLVQRVELPDDPADHRGALSWASQPKNKHMSEAGSYGYLITVAIPDDALSSDGKQVIRFTVPEDIDGGLALYGKDFGRYPIDPTVFFE